MKRIFRKLKPDECPICLGKLKLFEMEIETSKINAFGQKDDSVENGYSALLVCDECNSSFPVDKRGDCYKIKSTLPRIKKELKNYNPFQI